MSAVAGDPFFKANGGLKPPRNLEANKFLYIVCSRDAHFLGSNYIMLAGYTFIAVCNNKDGILMFQPTAVLIGFVKELTALDDYMCIIY